MKNTAENIYEYVLKARIETVVLPLCRSEAAGRAPNLLVMFQMRAIEPIPNTSGGMVMISGE